jgi:hypothetical protein
MVYVYIRFKAIEGDFSFEPAKWRRIFRGEVHYDDPMFVWLASRTEYCWLSEQRTSLNLSLRMNQIGKTVLRDLCDLFPRRCRGRHIRRHSWRNVETRARSR